MNKLTNAEEKVMKVLWKLNDATVSQVMAECNLKQKRTTVSTVIRVLEKRGFVRHKSYGRF
jgi:predicted transcriptional regulator